MGATSEDGEGSQFVVGPAFEIIEQFFVVRPVQRFKTTGGTRVPSRVNFEGCGMTTKVYRVIVQIDQPRDGFPGRVAEGAYIVDDGTVTLTNHLGIPVKDHEGRGYSKKLEPGQDGHVIAGRLTREFRRVRRGERSEVKGFSGPIQYPKSIY